MKMEQTNDKNQGLNADFLAWRVLNAKKHERVTRRHRAYNMRPRLRSDAHH